MSRDKILEALTKVQIKYSDLLYDSISCEMANHFEDEIVEIKELLAQPEQEVYQYRHKLPEDFLYGNWIECEVEQYKTYLSTPIKANLYGVLIEYQVRALYLAPPKREKEQEQEPLTEEEVCMLIFSVAGDQYSPPNRFELVRATEKAHGIGARNSDQYKERYETFGVDDE